RSRVAPDQVWPLERVVVEGENPARRKQHAAARIAPCSCERRQARDCANGHASARVALQAVIDSYDRRACRCVFAREVDYLFSGDAANGGGARWRKLSRALSQLIEAERVALDVVAV